jgi:hypothetical protein
MMPDPTTLGNLENPISMWLQATFPIRFIHSIS